MGNQCYATSQPLPRVFEEKVTTTTKLPELEQNGGPVGMALPLKSMLIQSERPTAISPLDVEVEVEPPPPKKMAGSYLVGSPQLEESIKQAWASLPTFLPSYQTKETYRDPFVLQSTGEIYYGQWTNEVPDGRGFLYTPHRLLFQGSWKDGVKNGRARMIFTEGHTFEGIFSDGRLHGDFTYTSPKLKFKGSYKAGQLNGSIEEEAPQYIYKGTINNGKRQIGELKWGDNFYSGSFDSQGRFAVKGTLKTQAGTYVGEFENGVKHGKGEFIWKSGLRYEGIYENNKKHGYGTLFLSDGQISYEGEWRNDLPHGRGHTVIEEVVQPDTDWEEGLQKSEIGYWLTSIKKKP